MRKEGLLYHVVRAISSDRWRDFVFWGNAASQLCRIFRWNHWTVGTTPSVLGDTANAWYLCVVASVATRYFQTQEVGVLPFTSRSFSFKRNYHALKTQESARSGGCASAWNLIFRVASARFLEFKFCATTTHMSRVFGCRPFTEEQKEITGQLLAQKVGGEHLATRSGGAAGMIHVVETFVLHS